ncbi:methylenetetrahydrofolate--tRNA-(uracil(54)-C(5))-methyltransferase (FADH(2)-oxidizing) TrmFO [Bdellovibrionota bacterium FG-1]
MSYAKESPVHVVGAGLAGCEAAHYLVTHGIHVIIHEMRPVRTNEAHQTDKFAELVCSNSLKSKEAHSAPGMLKAEMNQVGSLILGAAAETEVPGGQALAVDRDLFSEKITQILREHPLVTIAPGEVEAPPPDATCLLATGPLTSEKLSQWIARATGTDDLYFYDAIAPIVDASTIDMDHAFLANRYDKGEEEAYLNCPMNEEDYHAFIDALMSAEKVAPKNFEKETFFAGCQPIEAIANTGRESLRFGPMKPVGLTDPKTGRWAHAVVQLRPENRARTAYNLVGFQTKLKYGEQSRILRMIPALQKVEFLRLGSIHRNTYVCGPKVLRPDLSIKGHPKTYLGGQITGVEGYLESAACGMLAAMFIEQRIHGAPHEAPPANTALGALLRHVTGSDPKHYQPANMHFGLFDPHLFDGEAADGSLKKAGLRQAMASQALQNFSHWWKRRSWDT